MAEQPDAATEDYWRRAVERANMVLSIPQVQQILRKLSRSPASAREDAGRLLPAIREEWSEDIEPYIHALEEFIGRLEEMHGPVADPGEPSGDAG